jgi:hypothetical protein
MLINIGFSCLMRKSVGRGDFKEPFFAFAQHAAPHALPRSLKSLQQTDRLHFN